ncbi:hypothetical protein FisN_2Hh372 [Fistulifera solaris]|uniref:Uncharacterized protein n=1 Tax=Fistulifera solaris TaxID=1519565 RepID=A0A1Z5KKN8_FISSO|nr:hypothetical protein FisN_2Hh372 [Fistulifera solaris]|eukprot:GAX26685.1 hypothetical protein FisN_2Hh372 [Fistulifera solaris]
MSSHESALYSLSSGRLVNRRKWNDTLDVRKCAIAAAVLLILAATNPANWQAANELTTNYGLFHLQEYGNRLVLSMAYFDINCYYQSILDQRQGLQDICTSLRREFAHSKPLLWDPNDLAHVLHRSGTILLITVAVSAACRRKYVTFIRSGSMVIDALASILLHDPRRPLLGLLWCLFQENFLIYPVWKVLCKMVPQQVDSSLFHVFDKDGADIAVTVCILVGLVVLINVLGYRFWNRVYWLRFDGVLAVMLGYYRGILGGRPPDYSLRWLQTLLRTTAIPSSVSVHAVTWTFVLVQGLDSFPKSIFTIIANIAGASLGQYQYKYIGQNGAFQKVMDDFLKLFGASNR